MFGREDEVAGSGGQGGLTDVRGAQRVPHRVATVTAGGTGAGDGSHDRQDRGVTTTPDWLSSTLAADATGGVGALAPWVQAPGSTARITGPALVVGVARDDNSPMRQVPDAVSAPGAVLVVGGAAESRTAVLGDLVARELLRAGVVAVVTDGCVRDASAVRELGLPVWARGHTSVASRKDDLGYVGGVVPIAGAVVHDGDLVVADSDGVVVWPAAQVEQLLSRAAAKREADEQRLAAMET